METILRHCLDVAGTKYNDISVVQLINCSIN